jgi:MFS family permease
MWTLAVYLVGTGLSALAFRGGGGIAYFYVTRFIAGTGIGGEYSEVNSATDEMMPARYRGRTDIWINGSYWLGPSSARSPRSCCSTPSQRTWAGGSGSWSARCWPS